MNLSENIQIYFQNFDSKIQLERTEGGKLPQWSARLNSDLGRGFQVEMVNEEKEFLQLYSVDLKEKNICLVRAAIINLEDTKELIYNWIENKVTVDDIKKKYFALEKFIPIKESQNKYWKEWNDVKSYVFNYTCYYNKKDKIGLEKYNEMVNEIIVHPFFSQLKPDISINGLTLNTEDKKFPKYFISRNENEFQIYEPQTYWKGEIVPENFLSKEFIDLQKALDFYQELICNEKDILKSQNEK